MENGLLIPLTIIICMVIISIFYYWLSLRKKRHLITIESDWLNFEKAITNNHIEGVVKFEKELIWNEHFTMNKLQEMTRLISSLEEKNNTLHKTNKLKELKSLLYNKCLDWNIKPHMLNQYKKPY